MTCYLYQLLVLLVLVLSLRQCSSQQIPDSNITWIPSDQISCDDDYDCDFDNICVSGVCRCDINYRLVGDHCLPFNCRNDSECQSYDTNAICEHMYNKSSCVCKSHYKFKKEQRLCRIRDNQMRWLLFLTAVPLALVFMSCWFVYKTMRRPKDKSPECPDVSQSGSQCGINSPQTTHIIITDLQSLQSLQSYNNLEELFMASPKWQRFNSNTLPDVENNKRITDIGIDSRERQTGLGLT